MKTLSLVIFLFLLGQTSFCQEKKLSIENVVTDKKITIIENKRIKVITKKGKKFAGRFMVLDQNTIAVDGVVLDLNEIDIIRRDPLFNIIFIKTNCLHIGTLSLLMSFLPSNIPVLLALGGVIHLAAGIYGAIKAPNISKGYKVKYNWIFKIEGLQETKSTLDSIPSKR